MDLLMATNFHQLKKNRFLQLFFKETKMEKTLKLILYFLSLVLIILALSKSFKQYYHCSLDGDIAESVLPYPSVQKTFDDPIGIKTIINNDSHWGPNRFFSHYFLHKTFRKIPFLLQNSYEPIDSVYYTAAIAKLIMQSYFIYINSYYYWKFQLVFVKIYGYISYSNSLFPNKRYTYFSWNRIDW